MTILLAANVYFLKQCYDRHEHANVATKELKKNGFIVNSQNIK